MDKDGKSNSHRLKVSIINGIVVVIKDNLLVLLTTCK